MTTTSGLYLTSVRARRAERLRTQAQILILAGRYERARRALYLAIRNEQSLGHPVSEQSLEVLANPSGDPRLVPVEGVDVAWRQRACSEFGS